MDVLMTTSTAPINIAVIKYWGKRDEELILPANDSVSVTLSKKHMCATTTVACSPKFEQDRIWLNGKEQDMNNPRLKNCINKIKSKAADDIGDHVLQWRIHICSRNNFPTAAGLASSAAGYACLVHALGSLYSVKENLSSIARLGSGSACRSLYGGFVHWEKGQRKDGADSIAKQIAPREHWPELRVIILVVNADKKAISSTSGMMQSVNTSTLMSFRTEHVVPQRVKDITSAILSKDFHSFAEITMQDSNQFHAICLDTYPPIHYLNSTSFQIIEFVHAYNSRCGVNKVAYTFDAGPNACLYLLKEDVPVVINLITQLFPSEKKDYIRGLEAPKAKLSEKLLKDLDVKPTWEALQFIIYTEVGDGPETITDKSEFLLNDDGFPKELH